MLSVDMGLFMVCFLDLLMLRFCGGIYDLYLSFVLLYELAIDCVQLSLNFVSCCIPYLT